MEKKNKVTICYISCEKGISVEEVKVLIENPYRRLTEEEILSKLERSRNQSAQGKLRDADDVIIEMRAKYGLR